MKPLRRVAIPLMLAMTACATTGVSRRAAADAPLPRTAAANPSPPTPSLGPHLVIDPNTGTPVQAIDIGGGLFQPLTGGGGPIPGIPLN